MPPRSANPEDDSTAAPLGHRSLAGEGIRRRATDSGGLFGRVAIELGYCSQAEVRVGVVAVRERERAGERVRLGEVLVDARVLTPAQVADILERQNKVVLACDGCAAQFNAHAAAASELQCPQCARPLRLAGESSRPGVDQTLAGPSVELELEDDLRQETYASLPGSELGGYEVGELLGEGGMGAVFAARHTVLKREAALKVLPADLSQERERVRRFLREAETMGQVRHPNIVAIHNVGSDRGLYFIEMERVDGGTLGQRLRDTGPLAVDDALRLMMPVANALGTAHDFGVIHRDLKPENILLTRDGVPKIGDFGLAKTHEASESDDATALTGTGAVMGTPKYMSPEQCRGEPADARSDVYSLGAVFFEMLVGQPPFAGASPLALMMAHMSREAPAPASLRPSIGGSMSNLVERMLAKDPAERFQSAHDVVEALMAVAQGVRVEYVAQRIRQRRRRLVRYAVVVVGLALLGWAGVETVAAFVRETPAARARRLLGEAEAAYRVGADDTVRSHLATVATLAPRDPRAVRLQTRLDRLGEATRAWNTGALLECDAALAALRDLDAADPRAQQLGALVESLRTARAALEKRDADAARVAADHVIEAAAEHAEARALRAAAERLARADAALAAAEWQRAVEEARATRTVAAADPWANAIIDRAIRAAWESFDDAWMARDLAAVAAAADVLSHVDPSGEDSRARMQRGTEARREFDTRFQAGLAHLSRHDGNAACAELRRAQALWPTDEVAARLAEAETWVERNLAAQAADAGDLVAAVAAAERAMRCAPADPVVRAELGRYRGALRAQSQARGARLAADAGAAYSRGDLGGAERLLAEAERADPDGVAAAGVSALLRAHRACPDGFVFVPPGTYPIGAEDEADNAPRRVPVAGYYLAVHEVTNAEFARFVDAGGYTQAQWWPAGSHVWRAELVDETGRPGPAKWRDGRFPAGQEHHAVSGVSCVEAQAFCRWAGARLPTEVEWEVAAGFDHARGGARRYPWGDEWSGERVGIESAGATQLAPVGTHAGDVSALGVRDLAGGVMEWTASPWSPGASDRVIRGGSVHPMAVDILDPAEACRVARRHAGADPLHARLSVVGFRLARDAEP